MSNQVASCRIRYLLCRHPACCKAASWSITHSGQLQIVSCLVLLLETLKGVLQGLLLRHQLLSLSSRGSVLPPEALNIVIQGLPL